MSRWPGVYLIGLTGNIATGKSMVRKMLAELGAITFDADDLAHEALRKGAPAYAGVVQEFGRGILREGEEIDRARLGAIVFHNPARLARLEELVHPAVHTMIDARLREAGRPDIPAEWLNAGQKAARKDGQIVIVVEAIKLIESGLADACDQVWVTSAPAEHQIERLMRFRYLSDVEAKARINAQPGQLEKLARANVVLDDSGSVAELRAQVDKAWQKLLQTNTVQA